MHTAGASTDTTLQNMQLGALFYAAAQMAAALRQRKATFYTICFTIFSLVIIPVKKRKSSIWLLARCGNLLLLALTSACLGSVAYDSERGVRQMQLWFAFCKDDRAED